MTVFAGLGRGGGVIEQELRHAENPIHGGAQFVAHDGQKPGFGGVGAVRLVSCPDERQLPPLTAHQVHQQVSKEVEQELIFPGPDGGV